jgi:hypothetical protein
MSKDPLERKSYRKSPGRQYGYDYNPLQSQSGLTTSRPDALLVQRPDPRRTRQFLRQSIIAGKRSISEETEPVTSRKHSTAILDTPISISSAHPKITRRIRYTTQDLLYKEPDGPKLTKRFHHHTALHPKTTRRIRHTTQNLLASENRGEIPTKRFKHHPTTHLKTTRRIRYTVQDLPNHQQEERDPITQLSTRIPSRTGRLNEPHSPVTRHLMDHEEDIYEESGKMGNKDMGLEKFEEKGPLDEKYAERTPIRPHQRHIPARPLVSKRSRVRPEREIQSSNDYDPDRIYEEGEELPPGLRVVKRHKTSRRGLLVGVGMGAGILALGGIVATSELTPKSTLQNDHTSHAIQEAFNRGVAQGSDSVRRELVSALDALEGFTLQGAIDAAKLTRVSYDVFISPIVQFGSQLTKDFLSGMLGALKTARGWLAGIYQDNVTLAAIQHVLESWVDQVSKLPKQLDAITQTDLDGAQAYLIALQRKIADEKSKLDNAHATPTNSAGKSTPQPKRSSGQS